MEEVRLKVKVEVERKIRLKVLFSRNIDFFFMIYYFSIFIMDPIKYANQAILDQDPQISLEIYLPTLLYFSNQFSPSI